MVSLINNVTFNLDILIISLVTNTTNYSISINKVIMTHLSCIRNYHIVLMINIDFNRSIIKYNT